MVTFLTQSIAIVLVVIAIMQPIHLLKNDVLSERCIRMLSVNFSTGKNNGKANFIRSFQNLSIIKLDKLYKEVEGENAYHATERLLILLINTSYFGVIFNTDGLEFFDSIVLEKWCIAKAEQLIDKLPAFASKNYLGIKMTKNLLEGQCFVYLQKISPNFTGAMTEKIIFKEIYEVFSEDMLHYINIMDNGATRHGGKAIQYNTYFINKFTKPFYKYFEKKLLENEKDLCGQYLSVEDFCAEQGIQIIKDFWGLAPMDEDKEHEVVHLEKITES